MHIHILGIAGTMTTPLAIALQKQGHHISGSDQTKIYPPVSTMLNTASIKLNSTEINKSIDLCIVGSSYKSFEICRKEFEVIKQLQIPCVSATEYLATNLVKKNSIVVAGSYGKTTITSLLAHIFPSYNYFFGGQTISKIPSLNFSNSNWSIIEGDESINGLDTKAKFLYYPTKYVVLTSANWEHKDSYKTAQENFESYKQLVKNIPKDGALIYNQDDSTIDPLLKYCSAVSIPFIKKKFSTRLIGQHNQQNLSAVYTLAKHLGYSDNDLIPKIEEFDGVSRRLEVLTRRPLIIDDFAQSSTRLIQAVNSVVQHTPNQRIYVYFEPHASFLLYKSSLINFDKIFFSCHQVIIGKLKFNKDIPREKRVTAKDFLSKIGPNCQYMPLISDVEKYFKTHLTQNDTLIHFSTGGQEGIDLLSRLAIYFK